MRGERKLNEEVFHEKEELQKLELHLQEQISALRSQLLQSNQVELSNLLLQLYEDILKAAETWRKS